MTDIRLIKTEAQYERALARIDRLMDAVEGSDEAEELELLAMLVEHYEAKHVPIAPPDPLDAIEFRLDQLGLQRSDLAPYLGGKSKVSEVFARKRPLSLTMIRRLHRGLGIPAESLLGGDGYAVHAGLTVDWQDFPVREIIRRGWMESTRDPATSTALEKDDLIRRFLAPVPPSLVLSEVHLRKGTASASARNHAPAALAAWQCRVITLAQQVTLPKYASERLDGEFVRTLVRLSVFDDGPRLAKDYLAKFGVAMVVVGHLPRTRTDGAAIRLVDGRPVIALTLRYDRLDYFWFTLLHELGHVIRHLLDEPNTFIDDEDVDRGRYEDEADAFALDALFPDDEWAGFDGCEHPTPLAVRRFAERRGIHPAIVAGRIRHERNDYRLLARCVGQGQVRKHFPALLSGCA